MYGASVVLFEGILAFCHKDLLNLMDLKIFVDTDSDVRLARRCVCVCVCEWSPWPSGYATRLWCKRPGFEPIYRWVFLSPVISSCKQLPQWL